MVHLITNTLFPSWDCVYTVVAGTVVYWVSSYRCMAAAIDLFDETTHLLIPVEPCGKKCVLRPMGDNLCSIELKTSPERLFTNSMISSQVTKTTKTWKKASYK